MKINLAKTEVIHFVGIGGIGMSGLSLIMKGKGFKVQGSDLNFNKNIERLKKEKIKIFIGQKKQNLKDATIIVISSAIKKDNPEIGKEFAAQTTAERFKTLTAGYRSDSSSPPVKANANALAEFRLKYGANEPYYELKYDYSNKSKKYEPDFSAIPIGGLTYDPTQGKAFRRNKDGSFTELNPFDLSPLDADGTE